MNDNNASANLSNSKTSGRKRKWLIGCAGVAFLMLLMGYLFVWQPFVHDIKSLPKSEPYKTTRFEFRYGKATRVVDDPENHMRRVYGKMPDSITVTDGIRLIVYNEQKAVIHSRSDSMDAFPDSLQHGGYMGMSSTGTRFVVDHNGMIQEQFDTPAKERDKDKPAGNRKPEDVTPPVEDVAFFEKKYQKKINGVKPIGEYPDPDQFYSAIAEQLGIPEVAWKAAAAKYGWKKDDGKFTKAMVKGGPTAGGGQGTWDVMFFRFAVNPETKKPDPATMEQVMMQIDYDGNIKFLDAPQKKQ